MELTLLDYDMVHYRPSEVAAAALCLSQLLLDGLPWVSPELGSMLSGCLTRLFCCRDPVLFCWVWVCLFLNYSFFLPGHVTVAHTAALLHVRRGPPEASHAAHRQKRREHKRRENKVPGESSDEKTQLCFSNKDPGVQRRLFLQAVKNKYSSSKLMKISLIPQLKSSIVRTMAAALLNP